MQDLHEGISGYPGWLLQKEEKVKQEGGLGLVP